MADVSVFRGGIDTGGQPFLRCWHAETDTLPWVERRPDDPATADVVLLFGVYSPVREAPQVRVAVDLPAEHRDYGPDDGVEALTYSSIARRVRRHHRLRGEPGVLERRHHYVDVEAASLDKDQLNAYFRVTVARVPLDAVVRYTVTVSSPMSALLPGAPVASAAFQLRASAPEFGGDDVCAAGDGQWALLHRRENGFDHVRLDLLSTIGTDPRARPGVGLQIGDAPAVEADTGWGDRPADEFVEVPLIDRDADSILVSAPVPADGSKPLVHVRTAGAAFSSVADTSARIKPVLLMLINYCIQGLNDLFEEPVGHYDPPRTYMQVTMRDERGAWSSRPGSAEDGDPDGYGLTLDAHRFYRVPSMWAFNAAVLTMIAHDCPDELARLRGDIRSGLLVPVNAGFGAHRPPYYDEETNRQEILRGQQAITGFLPEAPAAGLRVYYPDQRLYEATPSEVAVYADDNLVTHLVLDRSTLCKLDPDHPGGEQIQFFPRADPKANRLLRDPATQRCVLPIEDAVREGIIASGDDCLRGKADPGLRGLFLQALPSQDQNLFVYADDADKASGCGWFDGDYAGNPAHFNEGYQATLCWLSRHPWVRVVTVADDAFQQLTPTGLDSALASATCPSVDPGGAATTDRYGRILHFDQWETAWHDYQSSWLGRSLGELSKTVEDTLLGFDPPAGAEPELADLAWMAFLGLHHEMMWNKEPLEGGQVNNRRGVISPEDFVVSATLQVRNAQVYLAAAAWSAWARKPQGTLTDRLAALHLGGDGNRYLDGDLLPNDLLYNDQVLAVLDRNGGRVTHLFTIDPVSGHALCVSGTPKAYQWIDPARIPCDGSAMENTVLTPNHLYVASDLHESAARAGWRPEDRPRQRSPQRWLYPGAFDEYAAEPDPAAGTVRYTYGPPTGMQPGALVTQELFEQAGKADRLARSGGGDPVVWHGAGLSFSKTIGLTERRLTVRYDDAPPDHLVGNEFCADLHAGLTGGGFQQAYRDLSAGTATFTGPRGNTVTLTTGSGCALSKASRLPSLGVARAHRAAGDYLRLHRVLTDAVEVRCPGGGTFEYVVDIG